MQPWNSATVVRIGRSRTAHPRELGDVRNRVRLAAGTASASQSAGSNRGDRAITFAAESRSGHCGRRNPRRTSRTRPVRLFHGVGPCRRRRRPHSLPLECRPRSHVESCREGVSRCRGGRGRRSLLRRPRRIDFRQRLARRPAETASSRRVAVHPDPEPPHVMNPLALYQIPHFVCDWVDVAAVADDLRRRRILLGFGPLGPTCDSRDGTHRRRRPG